MLITSKRRLYEITEVARDDDVASKVFDSFILSLIILNVLALVMSTVDSIYQSMPNVFDYFEVFSVLVFTVEYGLRIWCCTENPRFAGAIRGRIKYLFSFLGLVDLLAILPFYLPIAVGDYRFLRTIRLFRIFRLFKLARYSIALTSLQNVVYKRKEELFSTILVVFLMLLWSSSIMYYAESDAQPEAFSSIPMTMWWGVATLTTVGYGDVYPVTTTGKLLGAVVAILGIGIFALPAGIISAAFLDELKNQQSRD